MSDATSKPNTSKYINMSNTLQSFVSRFSSAPWLFNKETGDSQYEMLKSDEINEAENDIPVVVTIDDILDDIGLTLFHIKLFVLLGCLLLLEAFEMSMLSVISPVVKSEWHISIWEVAMIPLVTTCGTIVGSSITGWISDHYGRKRVLIATTVWIFWFGLASFLAINYYLLLVILFLTGLALAILTQVITNTEEFLPKSHRTKFSLLTTLFWTLGFFLSTIAGEHINYLGFRGALALVCVPAAMIFMGTPLIPESPQFCLASGDNEKALSILQEIAPKEKSAKFQSWKLCTNMDIYVTRGSIVDLFRHGYGKITCCLWFVWFFSYSSYYFVVFAATEFADISNNYSTLAWMSLLGLVLISLTALTSHFLSNKTLLLVLTSIAVLLQASLLFVGFNQKMPALVLLVLSRVCISCQTTLLTIYTSKVYPTLIRGIGLGIAFSFGRVGTIAGPFIAQTLFQKSFFVGTLVNVGSLVLALAVIVCLSFRSKN